MPVGKYWLLGKHLTTLNVQAGTRNASTGVITYASANSLLGQIDYIRFGASNLLDMIVSVDATAAHYEKTITDSNMTVGEILREDGTNYLDVLAFGYDYAKVTATRGKRTFVFEGVIGTYADGVSALGKNANELTLAQINLTTTGGLSMTVDA